MKCVEEFLEEHWDFQSPLLLALSGGSDSKALLHLLLQKVPRELLHTAHIDHSWREESSSEASQLKQEMEALKIPFHLEKVTLSAKNKEADGRDKRFAFFSSLWQKYPFQALILAHHREDLIETVLKRVFEGAHLPFLFGMELISQREEMTLWRPLLFTPKAEILAFLNKEKISYFSDPTNFDPHFLRARMRAAILPKLSQLFGKEILPNLVELSKRSAELKTYFDQKMPPIEESPSHFFIDFSLSEPLEIQYSLSQFFKKRKVPLRRPLLAKLVNFLFEKKRGQKVNETLFCDQGRLYFAKTHSLSKE